jgi:acyl carrier protein
MADLENMDGVVHLLKANKCMNQTLRAETLIEELEMDSIHMAGFLLDLEEQFRIVVPDEEFQRWIKLADIAEYIERFSGEYGSGDLSEM